MKKTWTAAFATFIVGGVLFAATTVSVLMGQVVSKSSVDVTVTDPYGRTVAGLEKGYFTITEGGVQRTITTFSEIWDENPKAVHYKVEVESTRPDAKLEVTLNAPRGLPPLTLTWK